MDLTNVTLATWGDFFVGLVICVFLFASLLLIGIVLLQKGRGGGLSSAFGGSGGASPFGTKTGDVFTWITVVLAGIFLACALALNVVVKPKESFLGVKGAAAPQQAAPAPLPEKPKGTPTGGAPGDIEFVGSPASQPK